MRQYLRQIKRTASVAMEAIGAPRFAMIRTQCRGMLTPLQYKEIYDRVSAAPDLDVVDIGAAGGGTTISVALAKADQGHSSGVVAVEKCEGGSRSDFDSYDGNKRFLESNFASFGVADRIRLFPHYLTHENALEVSALIQTDQLAGVLHDADGRVDRDFALFGPRLAEHNFVIVDDVLNKADFKPISERYPFGGTKTLVTWRLLEYLKSLSLFVEEKCMGPIGVAYG